MSSLIALSDVSLTLGAVDALSGVSLGLERGHRLALIGGNGSGKSSLLRVMHGLVKPSLGRVTLAPNTRLSFVFQKPHVLRDSVLANVGLGLVLRGVSRVEAETQALAALARVGLADLASRNARSLSIGQAQRVAMARALALEADVMLLDEPTASLDPHAKREVEGIMQSLANEGRTLVFASHNLGQVKRLATHVACLHQGRVAAFASTEAFFSGDLPHDAAMFLRGDL